MLSPEPSSPTVPIGLLTDVDLRKLICSEKDWSDPENTIHISPYYEESLTATGYDLRVGNRFVRKSQPKVTRFAKDTIAIRRGETVWIDTMEAVSMPRSRRFTGLLVSTVGNVRLGLSGVSSNVDADWEDGPLSITVHNFSNRTVKLRVGSFLCTLMLFKTASRSEKAWRRNPRTGFDAKLPEELDSRTMVPQVLKSIAVVGLAATILIPVWVFFGTIPVSTAITATLVPAIFLLLERIWRDYD